METSNLTFKEVDLDELNLHARTKQNRDVQLCALNNNPFKDKEIIPTKINALLDKTTIGSIICFPIILTVYNKQFTCNGGSSLYVNPQYRGYGIGTKLSIKRLNISTNKISLAAGLSHMSLPIYKKLGCTVFYPERYAIIVNSRILFSRWLKGFLLKTISNLANIIFRIPIYKNSIRVKYLSKNFSTINVKRATPEIEKIFNADSHPFKELHNTSWFNWHLNNSFSDNPQSCQNLYFVKKGKDIIGFFMTKIRFKENAAQGKLRNLLVGTIIEWGSINQSIITDKDLCTLAIDKLSKCVDIIDIITDNKDTISHLKKIGCKRNGNGNFAVYVGENSPLMQYPEYKNQKNWRIRPATSDNGLS